jgi:hypothetical protein
MNIQIRFYFTILWLILLITLLGACGDSSEEPAADAAPLPQDVPAAATATLSETLPPANPATETPVAEAPTAGVEAQPDANTPVMTFTISGGIVGFCDELNIDRDGSYRLQSCQHQESSGLLNQGDVVTIQAWHENLADFQFTSEDNPAGPDNLATQLIFRGAGEVEADERQRQVIFDWINGLMVRLRPQEAEPTPTPEPVATGSQGLCPEIQRPALLMTDVNSPDLMYLINPDDQSSCELTLHQLPFGRITTAADTIYYPIFDARAQIVSIFQFRSNEAQKLLPFTEMTLPEPAPFDFVISSDGAKIAWAWTEFDREADPPLYRNSLRVANIDGSEQVVLLDWVETQEPRFVAPIRFSADNQLLYYALQPDIGSLAFSGRFDNLYSIPTAGGDAQLLYTCPTETNPVCITGVAPGGDILTVIQPAENIVQIVANNGGLINTISLPATDYVERTVFGSNGNLAFVSAALSTGSEDAPPTPDPGYISFLAPPYTGEPQILLSDNSVGALWGWLDENRLVFGMLDESGNLTSSLITLDGQVMELSPNMVVGILQ